MKNISLHLQSENHFLQLKKKNPTTKETAGLLPMAFHLALTVQSESYYPDEKSIHLFFFPPFFFRISNVTYTVRRCRLAGLV